MLIELLLQMRESKIEGTLSLLGSIEFSFNSSSRLASFSFSFATDDLDISKGSDLLFCMSVIKGSKFVKFKKGLDVF